jgi:hypothetical protein
MYARDWHSIQMVPCVSSDAGDWPITPTMKS